MMDHFLRLYQYNQWANTNLCQHLMSLPEQVNEAIEKLSHIVAGEEIWYNRITPLEFELLPLFEAQHWKVLKPRLEDSADRWLNLIRQTEDFDRTIHYQDTRGNAHSSRLDDILIHLANHGTYHRGQIALLIRKSGQEPLPTDYILLARS